MFLRHIQLIFSSHVKTLKLGKCFVARNKFPDKLACKFQPLEAAQRFANKSTYIRCLASLKSCVASGQESGILACLLSVAHIATQILGRTLLFLRRELSVPAYAFSRCNGARDTIFSGTCAAPATLR